MARFARHSLVWLWPEGWQQALDAVPAAQHDALKRWQQQDWPAIVRRDDVDAAPDQVCLGVALPPDPVSGIKQRIALRVSTARIRKLLHPLNLERIIAAMPPAWRPHLEALAGQGAAAGISFKVYGSAALQCLTGERYLGAASDLDLLFHPASAEQLSAGLALLSQHASAVPLDGEIIFPSGQAVAWKEWFNAQQAHKDTRVLTKDSGSVRLMKMSHLLDTLEAFSCSH